jgi:hypothetical protein
MKYTVERDGVLILEDNGEPKEFDTYEQAEFYCYTERIQSKEWHRKYAIRVPYPLNYVTINGFIPPLEEE